MRFGYTVSALAIGCVLTACGGDDSTGTTTTPTVNFAPVVNAGTDQSAVEGATVQLAATATDANNDALTYAWSQTSGPTVTLSSATSEDPNFVAPDVTSESDIVLSLAVSDGTVTISDSVVITITDSATASSVSGKNQVQAPGRTATLSVNAATGDTIAWSQTSGTSVTLSDPSVASPTFTVPTVTVSETLGFSVTLNGTSTSETKVYVYIPPAYSAGLTEVGNFTDEDAWACDQSAGTASATVSDSSAFKTITGNGIPDYAVGTFPNPGNPNTISDQTISYQVTGTPAKTTTATDMQEFGVFLNGVKLERDTAERYAGTGGGDWAYEAITAGLAQGGSIGDDTQRSISENWLGSDCNNAHVQPTGQYHNHGFPEAYFQQLANNTVPTDMVLAGYAADGFPMYLRYGYVDAADSSSGLKVIEHSWETISGTRASGPGGAYDGTFRQDWEYVENSGDTDECGGRTGPTPEFPSGTYHYYITDDYPFIPRCVFGTPDASFRSRGGAP